jgi:hypothetical protein
MKDDDLDKALEQAEKLAPKLFRGQPRDAARIGPFTGKFAQLWLKHPDLRFFQVVSVIETRLRQKGWADGFYAEEPTILGVIEELLNE